MNTFFTQIKKCFVTGFFIVAMVCVGGMPASASQVSTSTTSVTSKKTVSVKKVILGAIEKSRTIKKTIKILPGDTTSFLITFKNTGNTLWTPDPDLGVFVESRNITKKIIADPFYDWSWLTEKRPVALTEATVAPKQTGTFSFPLFAPLKTGTYTEKFHLVTGRGTVIPNSDFIVTLIVSSKAKRIALNPSTTSNSASQTTPLTALGYKATQLLLSENSPKFPTSTTKDIRVGFKNTSKTSWLNSGNAPLFLRATDGDPLLFKHVSWNEDIVSALKIKEVKPGEIAFLTFTLSAPAQVGNYKGDFQLTAGEEPILGGDVQIPIEVQQGVLPSEIPKALQSEFAAAGPRGPNIRVGLFSLVASPNVNAQMITIAGDGVYNLIDSNQQVVKQLSGVTQISYDFPSAAYTVQNGSFSFSSAYQVKFVPVDPVATIFQITSYNNIPSWDTTVNFNRFRGSLEVRYAKATSKLWVIEQLPLEDYMRGLGETSNGSPQAFQKALVTAARTYALFVVSIGGKHKSEFFDVDTTGNDQVYKGYASELVRPNVVKAADETRGDVVTYNNDIVVTPYFSRSDGRTRAWSEVWNGSRPWLVSKPAPYDVGLTLWGHGVGMSASDAVGRAAAGSSWIEILAYYYTGITIQQLY